MNTSDYPKLYSWTQIKVKERLVVRKNIDVNEQMRLPRIIHLDRN
jgi:hypothetical protein